MTVTILEGDVLDRIAGIPDDSVDCCVTSPPYWALRDYGVGGQIGAEPTMAAHIAVMVAVMDEVRRVLKPSGTAWFNYGDGYAAAATRRSAQAAASAPPDEAGPVLDREAGGYRGPNKGNGHSPACRIRPGGGVKHKDLCMIANRLAIAMQDSGWWVRCEIVWHKPNAMTESVKDRPAVTHEKVWLLTKSATQYYYDAGAVRGQGAGMTNGNGRCTGQLLFDGLDEPPGHGDGPCGQGGPTDSVRDAVNLRNVWEIPVRPIRDAHFATMPPALAENCIRLGCPPGGTVLDPFGGSGTTGLVADRLDRDCILIELNPDSAALARRLIEAEAGLFGKVDVA